MEVIAVIPARLSSTRFPRKVLAELNGKTILQHVYERVRAVRNIEEVYIATSDDEIIEIAESFKAKCLKTEKLHCSGTSRIAEAIKFLDTKIILNVQADEPLISPKLLDELINLIKNDKSILILSPIKRIENLDEINDPNVVKVVFDKDLYALYFSRQAIPYCGHKYYKHIGVYCYRKEFLLKYPQLLKCDLEEEEKLEQLRFLYNGYKIKLCLTDYESIGIDTPQDLEKIKRLLS